jgi:peptide/nickel transport system substrate-binding protein
MTKIISRAPVGIGIAFAAVAIAACGGSDKTSSGGFASGLPSTDQKKGGVVTVLSHGDVDYIDPGQTYYQLAYQVTYATQRPLYSYTPENAAKPVPDLAASDPKVSADGRTITVKIRPGIKFSPPVNRAVTSMDVKYALTRGFLPSVSNGYAQAYFRDLVGVADVVAGKTKDLKGLTTPDDQTLVMRFTNGIGATAAQALSLPMSAPVPEEYARKFDAKKTTDYGFNQVATGPYMIRNDASGKAVGYVPGRKIELVRNPNWDGKATGDYRPAYLDRIDWTIGVDASVAGRQILKGRSLLNGDTPPAPVVKEAATKRPEQIAFTALGNRYVALNTKIKPFDDPNVRKAVSAALDRSRMQLTRGGKLTGDIATHYLAPNAPGFGAAGGFKGKGNDFLAKPEGDMKLAADYLRKAGFASGRYSGPPILMVATNEDPGAKSAQVVLDSFRKLGFNVDYRAVTQDAMYTNFCGVPKRKVHVCPSVGWLPDFNDGYAYLYAPFNGKSITPQKNSNWPQLDDPKINAKMDAAARISDRAKRSQAWGEIDDMVTATAAAIPWFWDKQPNVQSSNVHGVIAKWNAAWDLSFVSLK